MEIEQLQGYLKKTEKSAVEWLQIICQKRHCALPRYDEKDLKPYASAPPRFEVNATVNFKGQQYSAYGISLRKRDAKEEAATQILLQMNITLKDLDALQLQGGKRRVRFRAVRQNVDRRHGTVDSYSVISLLASKPDAVTKTPEAASGQCYVDLIRLCEKRGIPDPEYEDVKDKGPTHCETFRVLCRVRPVNCRPMEVIGESNNKKKARRIAAVMMLEKLQDFGTGKNSMNSIEIVSCEETEPRICCRFEPGSANNSLSHAQRRFKEMIGPTTVSLRGSDITAILGDASASMDILASIAEEENLMVMYSHVPGRESEGLCRWFCEIIDLEDSNGQRSAFIGEGDDEMNAHRAAALNALIFIKEASTAGTINISGSSSAGTINISGSSTDRTHVLRSSTAGTINISGSRTAGTINISGSSTDRTHVSGSSTAGTINISGSSTDRTHVSRSRTAGTINISGSSTDRTRVSRSSTAGTINISGSRTAGTINISGSSAARTEYFTTGTINISGSSTAGTHTSESFLAGIDNISESFPVGTHNISGSSTARTHVSESFATGAYDISESFPARNYNISGCSTARTHVSESFATGTYDISESFPDGIDNISESFPARNYYFSGYSSAGTRNTSGYSVDLF